MQSFLKGFLANCRRGWGNVNPPKTAAAQTEEKKPPKSQIEIPSYQPALDLGNCFQVGYDSVRRATIQLLNGLQTEPSYKSAASRSDMYNKWNSLIRLMLMHDIAKNYPNHNFITEDKLNLHSHRGKPLTDEPTWFIEPIDGTTNFIHGFPYVAVSVGFWLNKQPEFTIVWNPLLDQCFTARRGYGCFLNASPLRVSNRKTLKDALILHELGTNPLYLPQKLNNLQRVTSNAQAVRSLGSTQLNMCMVAQGFADAYYEFGCHAWDVAPAVLIVQEAGGVVLDPLMKPLDIMSRRMICASTHRLADELSKILIQLYCEPRDDESTGPTIKQIIDSVDEEEDTDEATEPEPPRQKIVPKRKLTRCPTPVEEQKEDPPMPGYGL